ncbi:DUF1659 domain-containing protein [Sporolactobacillus shoreicorticis]|uniref:DUF1659 domain-containing protein n=1 Tax=Sporolactobacillus shoreicorticis TaxID=1923877 RepID=A0ABW5S130_9BACL|nr:DUF1659 domain-containing protein [Sporolactobacillus shoreicorticis]MCO7128090.1 DUF1659 domain-containing protein [Sporolactobacillus shoreicorticis]
MATRTITESVFVMNLSGGLDEKGEQILLTKSFRNIKPAASEDGLLAIARKLAPLQQHPLVSVERNDTAEIVD